MTRALPEHLLLTELSVPHYYNKYNVILHLHPTVQDNAHSKKIKIGTSVATSQCNFIIDRLAMHNRKTKYK